MQNCNIRMGKDIWIKSNHLWSVHIYSNPFMLFLCSYIIEALSLSYFLLTSDRSTQIIFAKFHSFKSTIYNIKTRVTNIPLNMGYIFAFFRPYYIKSWHVNMATYYLEAEFQTSFLHLCRNLFAWSLDILRHSEKYLLHSC